MQKVSKYGEEEIEDVPIISYLVNHQKWVGIGLVVMGLYYLLMNVVIPVFSPMISNIIQIDLMYWVQRYFQTGLVCVLLIGGGIKLISGKQAEKGGRKIMKKWKNTLTGVLLIGAGIGFLFRKRKEEQG